MNLARDLVYCTATCSNEECWRNISTQGEDVDVSIMVHDYSDTCESLEED